MRRFNLYGSPDISFANNGVYQIDKFAFDLIVSKTNNGKYIISSSGQNSTDYSWETSLICLDNNGQLDDSFGTNGIVNYAPTTQPRITGGFVQSDDDFIFAGRNSSPSQSAFFKFNTIGNLDTSFGTNGVQLLNNSSFMQGFKQSTLNSNAFYAMTTQATPFQRVFVKLINKNILSTTENVLENNVLIYPVPFSNELNIELPTGIENKTYVELYNLNGQLILTKKLDLLNNKVRLNTSNIAKGIYLLKVLNQQISVTQKLIKQ